MLTVSESATVPHPDRVPPAGFGELPDPPAGEPPEPPGRGSPAREPPAREPSDRQPEIPSFEVLFVVWI